MLSMTVYKMFIVSFTFAMSQYLQNLETARLAIEKHEVAKQGT